MMEQAILQVTQLDLFSEISIYFPDYSRYSKKEISENKLQRLEKKIEVAYKQSLATIYPELKLTKATLDELLAPMLAVEGSSTQTENSKNEANSKQDARAVFAQEVGAKSVKENLIQQSSSSSEDNTATNTNVNRLVAEEWLILAPTLEAPKFDIAKLKQKSVSKSRFKLFIGPEGGFSDTELNLFEQVNDQNLYTFSLSTGILTSETATTSISTLLSLINNK
jgi:16S rRNA U1498 N3-methylase RsmE